MMKPYQCEQNLYYLIVNHHGGNTAIQNFSCLGNVKYHMVPTYKGIFCNS